MERDTRGAKLVELRQDVRRAGVGEQLPPHREVRGVNRHAQGAQPLIANPVHVARAQVRERHEASVEK